MKQEQLHQQFLLLNIVSETVFVSVCGLYYYRTYKRCLPLKAPYTGPSPDFPHATSNRIVGLDCTASSSDMTLLVLKSLVFALKNSIKYVMWQCQHAPQSPPSNVDTNRLLRQAAEPTAAPQPQLLSRYPRFVYQVIIMINSVLFPSLLASSWVPAFNDFYPSTEHCPDFFNTGWNYLTLNQSVATLCDTDAYRWQKFAWAAQFLWMVLSTLTVYQLSKIAYDTLLLTFKGNEESLHRLFSTRIQQWNKFESLLAPLASCFMLVESLSLGFILCFACYQFPNGFRHLIQQFFTTALTKVDTDGQITMDYLTFTINLTQLDQRLFYGFTVSQLLCLPSTLALYGILQWTQTPNHIRNLVTNCGNYLRNILEYTAIAMPILATTLFTGSSVYVNQYNTCYLDNFWNSLFNLFNQQSEQVISSTNASCSLMTLSPYQGMTILQTVLLTEAALILPTALLSLVTLTDLLFTNRTPSIMKRLSFFQPNPIPPQQSLPLHHRSPLMSSDNNANQHPTV